MKSSRLGAKAVAAFLPEIIGKALTARGIGEATLIADWPAIVGERVARFVRPIELRWPASPQKQEAIPAGRSATLVLRVDGAFALEAQHSAAVIVARVNAHLGWRCVEKLAFRQGPLPPPMEIRSVPRAPSEHAKSQAEAAVSAIEDGGLREALTRLGAAAIDREAIRAAAIAEGRAG